MFYFYFSAVDPHIFPEPVQMNLERVGCWCIDDVLWQVVPVVENSAGEQYSAHCRTSPIINSFAPANLVIVAMMTM